MTFMSRVNLEQLAWPGTDLDAILVEVEADLENPAAYLCANLGLVSSKARRGVVILLGKLGDRRALSTLMRYVFDSQGRVLEEDARASALQVIISITDAQPADSPERRRVAKFLTDMRQEPDGFVRGHIMRGLGRFGSRAALETLKEARGDAHPFVAEQARLAYRELSDRAHLLPTLDEERLHKEMDDGVLLDRIRFVNITELKPYLYELGMRPNALELVDRYLTSGSKRNHYVLEILPDLKDPAGRDVVARHLQVATGETDVAASLGALMHYLDGDASGPECAAIADALQNPSAHIQRAAILAAGRAGSARLLEQVVTALTSTDLELTFAAATALDEALGVDDARWLPDLQQALARIRQRRIKYEFPRDIQSETLLRRTIARITPTLSPAGDSRPN